MNLNSLLVRVYIEIELRERDQATKDGMIAKVGKFYELFLKGYRWCEIKRELDKEG